MQYLIKPWEHQLKALGLSNKLPNFGFFFEMGSGKTSTCINELRFKYQQKGRLLRTLIFCPPIVIENWKKEFLAHSKIPPEFITCLTGTGKNRLKLFNERKETPHIFITNYETLSMDVYEEFIKWDPEAVVFDESHRLKNYTSKRSKLAEKLVNGRMLYNKKSNTYSGKRPYVYVLSGSPILNSPMDIFQQYKILDAGETFGANFFGFRSRYFRDKNAGMPKHNYFPDWVPIPGAMEEIGNKLSRNSMRVLKKDCMDLPPFVRKTIEVEMSPGQRKLYDSMLEDFVAYITKDNKDHVTTATMAMTKGMRLMQIASGYIKTVDGTELNVEDGFNPKQEALCELLEQLVLEAKQKVLVWCVWKQNYSQIKEVCEKLKIKYVEAHGDISYTQKQKAVEEFSTGEAQVFIGHPASLGIGVNLVAASYSIFYSRNFSLEQDLQAEARNYRGGTRHDKVTRIDLISKNSIEEKILEALQRKEAISTEILKEITVKIK